ncbi:MAG: 5-formyltetrahydrofolate cyclo-ligase [SAR324 cluster bacterium]|nr:5-formyltetrahydrofolate cyclo-ligase [SAR324 cluster bacterium]
MRQCRKAMDLNTIDATSRGIFRHLLNSRLWQEAKVIHTFLPQNAEPNTFFLVQEALKTKRRVQVPKVAGPSHLTHHWLEDIKLLKKNSWGIPEIQDSAAHVADLSEIDLVLVPGLAFSRKGARLGQGRGYYDRFLNQFNEAKTLGVGFDWQLLEHIPEEPHDRRLDGVLTESQIFGPLGE